MYAGVPIIVPVWVSGLANNGVLVARPVARPMEPSVTSSSASRVSVSGWASGSWVATPAVASPTPARASPKSITRTRPSSPSITLSGLKSRWIRPACVGGREPPTGVGEHVDHLGPRPRRLDSASHSPRVWPATNSIPMNS